MLGSLMTSGSSEYSFSLHLLSCAYLWPFCGQNSHKLPLLAALTEISRPTDSQSSNPGSIPGSATNYHPPKPANSAGSVFAQKVGGALCLQKALPVVHKMVHRDFDPKKAGFSTPKSTYFWLKAESQKSQPLAPSPRFRNPLGHTFGTDGDNSVGVLLIQD